MKPALKYAKQNNIQVFQGTPNNKHRIGIHLKEPTQSEIYEAVDTAIKDSYPAIYLHPESWENVIFVNFATKEKVI